MSQPQHLTQEADIGSGERSAGQHETDKMIEQVPDNKTSVTSSKVNQTRNQEKNTGSPQSGNPP